VIDENTWQAAYTYRWRKGRCIYMFRKRFATWCVYVYICMPGGLLIKTIRHWKQANESTFMWVVCWISSVSIVRSIELGCILAAGGNVWETERERTKACVAINSIMHAALFLLMLVDGVVVVVVCYYHWNTFSFLFSTNNIYTCEINDIDCRDVKGACDDD
jgi:hypothetical protein